jgi:predicted ATPase
MSFFDIVRTTEEKDNLIEILDKHKIIYFYGGVATGKSYITDKFQKMYPDKIILTFNLNGLHPSLADVKEIEKIYNKKLFGKRVYEDAMIFIHSNHFNSEIHVIFPHAFTIEFVSNEKELAFVSNEKELAFVSNEKELAFVSASD